MIGTHLVTVAGADITCLADDVDITHGRSDASSQPEASAATLNITVGPGAPLPAEVDIGADLTVDTMVGGVTSRRFTGRVTDIAIGWDDAGPGTPDAGVGQIVAVSVLGDYARRVVGDEPFPQELDGARVARVFALAGLVLSGITSDPGVVEVIPRDVDARAALEVAHGAADSAGGLVWETRAGDVRYADAEHRRGAAVELDLHACDILVTPTWARTLAGLVNEITMGYGVAPEGGGEAPTYHTVNEASRAKWGRYGYSVTTELARWEDAFSASSLILAQNAGPVWMLNALPVDVAGLTTAETHALLALDVHSLLRVTGLPYTGSAPTSLGAWVEGWTEHLAFGVHDLELTVSDYCRTVPGPRWNDLDAATTWDTVGTATWDEWACLGGPIVNRGRWDDVPASTRWDMVPPDLEWDQAVVSV